MNTLNLIELFDRLPDGASIEVYKSGNRLDVSLTMPEPSTPPEPDGGVTTSSEPADAVSSGDVTVIISDPVVTEPPPDPVLGGYTIDPDFDPVSLAAIDADAASWFAVFKTKGDAAINSSGLTYIEHLQAIADTNDCYAKRTLDNAVEAALFALSATGDPEIGEFLIDMSDRMRAAIDTVTLTHSVTGESVTFNTWRLSHERFSPTGQEPRPDMYNSPMTFHDLVISSLFGKLALVGHQNRHIDPRYGDMADYWIDYLQNHLLAKWYAHKGGTIDRSPWVAAKLIPKDFACCVDSLSHAFVAVMVTWLIVGEVTGEARFRNEGLRMFGDFSAMVPADGSGWDHRVPDYGKEPIGDEPIGYAGDLTGALAAIADLLPSEFLTRVAANWRGVYAKADPVAKTCPANVGGEGSPTTSNFYDLVYNGTAQIGIWEADNNTILEKARAIYQAHTYPEWHIPASLTFAYIAGVLP